MATFYLLPPRPLVNQRFKEFAARLLPGLTPAGNVDLVALLQELIGNGSDTYLVHPEDLPSDEDPVRALVDGFGAEPGDIILEIRFGTLSAETSLRRLAIRSAA
jgi:hypothetical protein